MLNKTLLIILFSFTSNLIFSQNLNSHNDIYNFKSTVNKKLKTLARNTNENVLTFDLCDGDGIYGININQIENEVLSQFGLGENDSEAVIISTNFGEVIKLDLFNNSNEPEVICPMTFGGALSDVAIDENETIYLNGFSNIYRLDESDCSIETVLNLDSETGLNSLSFDTDGNLYYGSNQSSAIYRYDADEANPPYIWHDFNTGSSGGDFVILNGKMYVAWNASAAGFRLYEVTYDSNFNYQSHIDLGLIKNNTFGLASEFGKLYGVTPSELYKINLNNLSFNTILTNDGTYGVWFGASGLHEAITYSLNTYYSYDSALNSIDAITSTTINIETGSSSLFIRIDNLTTGTFEIIEVVYNIGLKPNLTQPDDINICRSTTDYFELTDVENQLLQNVNQDVIVTYYETTDDRLNETNTLDQQYLVSNLINDSKLIYLRVDNLIDDCFSFSQFNLRLLDLPNIKELSTISEGFFLENCYVNSYDQGYFDLNEIIGDIVFDEINNLTIQFFPTYTSAQNNTSELNTIYFSSFGVTEELFIKVTNQNGCSEISNFFIDGDCPLYTPDLTNIRFPKFFTPNNDGFNDYWNVKGISNKMRNDSEIVIFNRYGKLLYTFKPGLSVGWDGSLNNKILINDDYWYIFSTKSGQSIKGHFSLIK